MSLSDKLKGIKFKSGPKSRKGPLWEGPCGTGEQGGITQSMLQKFLVCRERFRLRVVEGLKTKDQFQHRLEYGNMWHLCEEEFAGPHPQCWPASLQGYAQKLCRQYPMQQEEIDKWYRVCKVQFPEYVKFWASHKDVVKRTPLLQEAVFDVPYALPSGRVVRLRGKWDSVDLIGKGEGAGVYLQENKTKGEIIESNLKRQLTFDIQSMFYLTALRICPTKQWSGTKPFWEYPLGGIRYNVIKRPLSGGSGSITRHKATKGSKCPKCKAVNSIGCPKCGGKGRTGGKPEETKDAFYKRLQGIIAKVPQEFFMRWRVEVQPQDIARFRREFLDPILEQLCDWWEWVSSKVGMEDPFATTCGQPMDPVVHWRHPFGVWNYLDDGGFGDVDAYLESGSEVGLSRTDQLFGELQ